MIERMKSIEKVFVKYVVDLRELLKELRTKKKFTCTNGYPSFSFDALNYIEKQRRDSSSK